MTLRRWRGYNVVLVLLVFFTWMPGCNREIEMRLRDCTDKMEGLERTNASLESDVTRLKNEAADLRRELRKTRATLIGSRMGLRDASVELFATMETSKGKIVIKFFWRDAPYNVQNFVELAEGTRSFVEEKTGQTLKRPFYDGLTFHRVIPDFMIQGGDPLGTGMGGPGYALSDELESPHKFDRPGIVAMANAGPDTVGSQFFITVAPKPDLDGHYTIIGEVVEGEDVVKVISQVATNDDDRPLEPVYIKSVRITRTEPQP